MSDWKDLDCLVIAIYTLAVATVQRELMFVIGTGVNPVWTHVAVIVAL